MRIVVTAIVILISSNVLAQEAQPTAQATPQAESLKTPVIVPPAPMPQAQIPNAPPSNSTQPPVVVNIQAPTAPQPPTAIAPPESFQPKKSTKSSLSLFVSNANTIKFDSVSVVGGGANGSGSVTYGTDSALGLAIEVSESPKHNWGWSTGLSYDFERYINSVVITLNGASTSGVYTGDRSRISFLNIYGNLIYKWENFYLPFGLNYSIPNFKRSNDASNTTNYTVTGAVGAQLGIGVSLSDKIDVEILSRGVGIAVTATSSPYYYDFGTGYLAGIQANLKFNF